jgi:hypothetical protein
MRESHKYFEMTLWIFFFLILLNINCARLLSTIRAKPKRVQLDLFEMGQLAPQETLICFLWGELDPAQLSRWAKIGPSHLASTSRSQQLQDVNYFTSYMQIGVGKKKAPMTQRLQLQSLEWRGEGGNVDGSQRS